ncbi:MAG: LysM peptidoglycan-binding domain-containing protein [Chloroflexi bacterium]|nr:MAG: LysM peptidoglycan-binding domain-containing protein [Chloroflexota bacterium]
MRKFSEQSNNASLAHSERLVLSGAWLVAASLVLLAFYLGWRTRTTLAAASEENEPVSGSGGALVDLNIPSENPEVDLPGFQVDTPVLGISRSTDPQTIIPTRPREDTITYTVDIGDSVFEIALSFNLKPETILWGNYDQLKDSPDMLSPGMVLNIPPVDGVLYEWQEGDTIDGVALKFSADPVEIMNWPGNDLDLTDPKVEPGTTIMVKGGEREFVQWIIPTIPRGRAGVSKSVYGPGACEGGYDGYYGGGFFIWPAPNHKLSGNDYWSGHLGIDIAAGMSDPIYASDAGVIVFSGWAYGGYGNMVMVDHGNGYQTVYAHLSSTAAGCGRSVGQGTVIGYAGSTGNSTGTHLHFEIRYMGGFVNPWWNLP